MALVLRPLPQEHSTFFYVLISRVKNPRQDDGHAVMAQSWDSSLSRPIESNHNECVHAGRSHWVFLYGRG